MRNQRGVSLVVLIITIVVMIILAMIALRVGTTGIDTAQNTKIRTEMRELEKAVTKRFSNNAINEDAYPLLGKKVTVEEIMELIEKDINYNSENVNYKEETISRDIDYIRKLSSSNVGSLGIKNTTGYSYIVNYISGKIYGPIGE